MIPAGGTRTGVISSWLVLGAGATAQIALEAVATASVPARTLAVCLVLGVLAANVATARARMVHRLRLPGLALLLVVGLVFWLDHGRSVLRAYGEGSMLTAALPPVLIVAGTVLLQLASSER